MNKAINWVRTNPPLSMEDLYKLKNFPFKLSNSFLNLLTIQDGGSVNYGFKYCDVSHGREIGSGIGYIFGVATQNTKTRNKYYDPFSKIPFEQEEFCITYNNIIDNYYNPPEFFPKNLLAFGETGNGDLLCFDYRENPSTDDPLVVYWNHGAPEGKDVSFVADNFESFISILEEPEK